MWQSCKFLLNYQCIISNVSSFFLFEITNPKLPLFIMHLVHMFPKFEVVLNNVVVKPTDILKIISGES